MRYENRKLNLEKKKSGDGIKGLSIDVCAQLHMLGSGRRGSVIEMTLAKVLHMSSKSRHFTR